MLSYFMRHWRGELPLAVAWWVNGVGITALSLALDFYGSSLGLVPAIETRGSFTAFLVIGVFVLFLVPAWQVIGIFHSADRHAEEVGTILVARGTQVVTTLLTVALAMRFLIFTGESYSGARIAYPIGGQGYSLATTHNGRLLEVSGSFIFGLADEVQRALEASPRVRRVRLNSGGGSLSEARKVRALILARQLDTDSTQQCNSACVSVYIAGRHRLLHRAARMGFHLPRNPGFGLRSIVTAEYAAELGFFGHQGVPRWFLERWIASGRAFWFPTPAQLWKAGVVQSYFGRPLAGEEIYFR